MSDEHEGLPMQTQMIVLVVTMDMTDMQVISYHLDCRQT